MKRILPAAILIGLLFTSSISASASEKSGSSNVSANVTNTAATATPTSSVPTSTPIPITTSPNTPTPTPSPGPGGPTTTPAPTPGGTQVIFLDISGFTSPNASIVMTTNNSQFVRSTTADAEGNFFISQIGVSSGFNDFCLQVVDFRRVGDSSSCFRIPPVNEARSIKNLFLPPTLGLSASQISTNESAFAFGYSMKGAKVTVHISGGVTLVTDADKNGYYSVQIDKLPVGTYQLFATANYQKKESELPNKPKELQLLSTGALIKKQVESILARIISWIVGFVSDYGWLAVPAIILFIILISKKGRDVIKKVAKRKNLDEEILKHGSHHAWMLGF